MEEYDSKGRVHFAKKQNIESIQLKLLIIKKLFICQLFGRFESMEPLSELP